MANKLSRNQVLHLVTKAHSNLTTQAIRKGKDIIAALMVTAAVMVTESIFFILYAKILDNTYPKAEIIIATLGNKFFESPLSNIFKVSNPIINRTPNKPINIDINLINENLSSLVIKWERISAKIGAIDISNPAVFDLI